MIMKRIIPNVLTVMALLISSLSTIAQTNVPALITSDQTWTIAGSPYLINQMTYIDTGVSVKVMPGVEVLSQGNYKILIDGEFQVLGTSDSMVLLDKLQLEYRTDATAYNSATGAGAFISHAHFTGAGSGKFSVNIRYKSARIEHSTFTNTYYGIYTTSSIDSSTVEVDGCTFIDSTGYSYPIYTSGTYSTIDIRNSNFIDGSYMYIYGNIIFHNNNVDGLNRIYFTSYGGADISCNSFKNINNAVELRVNTRDTNAITNFSDNTIDSAGNSTTYPMMRLSRISSTYTLGQFTFSGNNFLTNNGSTVKLDIDGSNNTPSSYISLDMNDNYWGSTDSATIAGYIYDYSDDITVFAKADVSTYLGQANTACGTNSSTCTASFYLAVDTSSIYNLYVINNSTGTSSTTSYLWTFGDGDSSTAQTPTHTYTSFGVYNLCLTISDTANGCYSTYCDSMGLDSSGNLLKTEGFNLIVLNESDLLDIVELDPLVDFNVYPNPTVGTLNIEFSTLKNENVELMIYNQLGELVHMLNYAAKVGPNIQTINLNEFSNGMYLVYLKAGNQTVSRKILKH